MSELVIVSKEITNDNLPQTRGRECLPCVKRSVMDIWKKGSLLGTIVDEEWICAREHSRTCGFYLALPIPDHRWDPHLCQLRKSTSNLPPFSQIHHFSGVRRG